MSCRHVAGQDVWCGCHWHATHSALNSPSGIPCTQVCTDRDAGCPHCCCLAPVWQDALHHLGYVLPLLMQLDFVGFPHCCLPHSALVSLAFRYLPYRCVDRYSSKCAPPHTLFQMSSCTHLRLKATELTPFFLSCAHHLLGCVPSKSRKCCCFNQLARPEAGLRSCNATVRI